MRPFIRFLRDRVLAFLLNLSLILGLMVAVYFDLWEIYLSIFLLLLGGYILFKLAMSIVNRWDVIEDRIMFVILSTHKGTRLRKVLEKRLIHEPAYHILRQGRFHELAKLPVKYLPLTLKIINDHPNLRSLMTPTAQKLLEQSVQNKFQPNSLFEIITYYRLTPRELAQLYIKNHFLAPTAHERLIYEAGYEERQLLENNLPLNNPLLLQIEDLHQIILDSQYSLLI